MIELRWGLQKEFSRTSMAPNLKFCTLSLRSSVEALFWGKPHLKVTLKGARDFPTMMECYPQNCFPAQF